MIFLKLLLSSGLIFITAMAFTNKSLCYQPSKYVIPMHYDIMLSTFIEGNIFYGEYNISIMVSKKTQHIYLHSKQLCIKNIVLFTNLEKHHENDIIYKPTYNIKEDTIDISFLDELSPGNYILYIKYFGTADKGFRIFNIKETVDKGFSIFDVKETAWIATPHFQIISDQRSFSCRDQQDLLLEATFNIYIECKQCTALSNMLLRNTEEHVGNLLWRRFHTTPVMLTNLATMIVSNYLILLEKKSEYINMWCRNESRFHIEFAKHVIKRITRLLEYDWRAFYRLESKVDHVAIPNFHDKGIIVFGLVLYREADIIYDKNLYPTAQKIEVTQLVGRKVTQQWFNNMMNNPLLSDVWLKKGLTTLLATNLVNKAYPDCRIMNLFVVQNQHYSLNLDGNHMWPTSQDDSLLKIRQSIRAPFILRMMQHILTEEIFEESVATYAYDTDPHDEGFVALTKHIALKKNSNITQQLTKMEDWALENHCPVIKAVRNYHDREIMSEVNVSIQYIDTLKIGCVPVTFTTKASLDFNNFTHHMVCVSKDLKLSLPFKEDGWMIFNIQQVGYYRVNYDDENWQRISNYLNSDNYMKIHVLNRAQIIDDAFHLMIAGKLQIDIFWDLLKYLDREEDYVAWYPMFKAMEYMYGTFLWKEMIIYTSRIRHALHKLLKRIKYEEIEDIDELKICLRQEATRWACFLDDIDCKKEAKKKLEQHLQDPTKHKLLPWWKEWTYCKGLMITTKEKTTWKLVYDIGLDKSDTKFSEYLACPEDIDVIRKYLVYYNQSNLIYYDQYDFTEQYQYHFDMSLHIITKHAKNQTTLQYILNDFYQIKPKDNIIPAAVLIIIINNVHSLNLTEQIKESMSSVRQSLLRKADVDEMKEKDLIMQHFGKIESKISIRNDQIERQIKYSENIFL